MHDVLQTLSATWSPFVLVAGLLLIGHVASGEGLFRLVGAACARVPGGGVPLFLVTMVAVALVTAVLNLDTSVVFMTPVALFAARAKGTDEKAFLYGTIFMSNSASLLLLGSNLTNLLVFSRSSTLGSAFARHMVLAWVIAVVVTIAVVLVWRWRPLRRPVQTPERSATSFVFGPGVLAVAFAVLAMLFLRQPALWVFVVGVVTEVYDVTVTKRSNLRDALTVTNPWTLSILFIIAVAVGWFARFSTISASLLRHASVAATVATSAFASIVINNLPAASLFAAHRVAHPYALLLGLDLGPNILVTGALSSLLWMRIARRHDVRTSVLTFSLVGSLVAVVAMVCAAPLV
ncbi:MAG TPA: SLC13 family permease [Acidimicrobiales bacterium]|nr:SLC13 family permease [Acidimicrobiales bacterium]